ncbi:hypothetical protein V501_01152 [Pseudogymnoascus sp. VKM F-4519 (FW-2642)]|nr:hypothetical protein V501_01152 [Pseudogymnoascus sp. VKM F-4519 (FW-2642)]
MFGHKTFPFPDLQAIVTQPADLNDGIKPTDFSPKITHRESANRLCTYLSGITIGVVARSRCWGNTCQGQSGVGRRRFPLLPGPAQPRRFPEPVANNARLLDLTKAIALVGMPATILPEPPPKPAVTDIDYVYQFIGENGSLLSPAPQRQGKAASMASISRLDVVPETDVVGPVLGVALQPDLDPIDKLAEWTPRYR